MDGARTTEVEETPKIDPGEESSVSEETVTPTHVSHDNDNNPVQIYEFPAKCKPNVTQFGGFGVNLSINYRRFQVQDFDSTDAKPSFIKP